MCAQSDFRQIASPRGTISLVVDRVEAGKREGGTAPRTTSDMRRTIHYRFYKAVVAGSIEKGHSSF